MRLSAIIVLAACATPGRGPRDTPTATPRSTPSGAGERSHGTSSIEQRVLDRVDRYRALVGLSPVTLDPELSRACMSHARYMLLNRDTDAMVGLAAHRERPDLPGATPAGARCGKAADLFPGVADLEVAVDDWMSGLYHRRPILSPALSRIGVGYARLPDGSYMAALMFVEGNGIPVDRKWPVAYPSDRQTGVPLEFGGEIPDPVPGGGRAGYPITLQFPPFDKLTRASARLSANGKDVPVHFSSPERPATSFGQYGVIALIPKLPLAPSTRYTVTTQATWQGQPGVWRWSFTTLARRRVDAHDEAAVVAALAVPSTLRGRVVHGGMMDADTAFLQIGERTLAHHKMISVLIPKSIWIAFGGERRFAGKTVEVDGTPRLVQGVYINIPIATASQLRIVPASY